MNTSYALFSTAYFPPISYVAAMLDKQVVVVEQNGSFQVKIPKNFVCEHCFGAFRSSYHLKRHILIHTGKSLAHIQRGSIVHSLCCICM